MTVTGEQVRAAVAAAGISKVDHHDCSICGYMTAYIIEGDNIYFDAGCDCSSSGGPPRPETWEHVADWINMQRTPEARNDLRTRFGLPKEEI